MPLDANKAAHIQAVLQKTYAGRQQSVVFVYLVGGSYTYVPVQVILRPQNVIDPQIPSLAGAQPKAEFDMLMVAPLGTNFTGVVFVAATTQANASAVAAAAKYEVITALPTGMLPGGTHIVARLRRFR